MALDPTSDPLDRALQAAREETPEGWGEVSRGVMSRVRNLVTPSEPVLAFTPDGAQTRDAEGSHTYVATRVLVAALRGVLQGSSTYAPDRIGFDVEDERLVGVELSVACAYGVDLRELADRLRDDVLRELRSLVGPDPAFGPAQIGVQVSDVVDGDPNLL